MESIAQTYLRKQLYRNIVSINSQIIHVVRFRQFFQMKKAQKSPAPLLFTYPL